MIPIKEKLDRIRRKIIYKVHDRECRKHFLAVTAIVAAAGLLVSMFITRNTTVNDVIIRYTDPPVEELDTEGYSGEELPEDIPSEPAEEETHAEETPVPEETPALEETSAPEEIQTPEETPAPEEIQAPEMTYIPEVQIKTTLLSTMHRPWILSRLSDMFHSLSTPK